jgi:hypothetical protein
MLATSWEHGDESDLARLVPRFDIPIYSAFRHTIEAKSQIDPLGSRPKWAGEDIKVNVPADWPEGAERACDGMAARPQFRRIVT